MRLISRPILLILLLVSVAQAQTLAGLSPPIRRVTVLADTRSEDPPVYSGITTAPPPNTGETVEIQVFVPQAAGKEAFGYILNFDDTNKGFTAYFTITSARAWTVVPVLDASGQAVKYVLSPTDMSILKGSTTPGRSILFVSPPIVPANGLIATFVLTAKQNLSPDLPLKFTVSVSVYSTTPPARLWNLKGQKTIHWL